VDRPLISPGPMTSCVIDGALVLSDSGFAAGTVLVEGRQIAAVAWSPAERETLRARAGTVVAAERHWLIPGLVDGHAHGYAALLRGTENSLPLELWAFYTVLYGRAFDAAAMRSAILPSLLPACLCCSAQAHARPPPIRRADRPASRAVHRHAPAPRRPVASLW